MILDTNVYGPLKAGNSEVADIVRSQAKLAFPVPVLAELRAGFLGGDRFETNMAELRELLSRPLIVVLDINLETTGNYADLQNHCRRNGKALSNNDIWIAAIAQRLDQPLLTYDQDFAIFEDLIDVRLLIHC